MAEFGLIRRLQELISPAQGLGPACVIGIGDDAAVVEIPAGYQAVICTDTLVEGTHFVPATDPRTVGHKALAVNLSDLAAMGARPAWFFLSLTLPAVDEAWIDAFALGMAELAADAGIELAGGDTTSGPLNICVTATGLIETGQALTRSGAQTGDLVAVSGYPGRAAYALAQILAGEEPYPLDRTALDTPCARLALGQALSGLASACIDVSDGLLADLGHVLKASARGAEIDLAELPCPPSMRDMAEKDRWELQLAGGDDYELCFTIPAMHRQRLDTIARESRTPLTVIGRVTEGNDTVLRRPDGCHFELARSGYEHFFNGGDSA